MFIISSLFAFFAVCFIDVVVVLEGKETVFIVEREKEVLNFFENPPLINIIHLDPVKFNLKCPKLLLEDMYGQDRLFHDFLTLTSLNSTLRSSESKN
jgi:hypothetical protein